MLLRFSNLTVCIYYLFLGKCMESKTQVFMGMMVLACIGKIRGPACGKSENIRIFQEKCGLQIPITANLKIVNSLDVTFLFCTRRYQPYKKQNESPIYINAISNHPLISSRHCLIASQKEQVIFHLIKQHLSKPYLSIMICYL